jgi:hypothetical protein
VVLIGAAAGIANADDSRIPIARGWLLNHVGIATAVVEANDDLALFTRQRPNDLFAMTTIVVVAKVARPHVAAAHRDADLAIDVAAPHEELAALLREQG